MNSIISKAGKQDLRLSFRVRNPMKIPTDKFHTVGKPWMPGITRHSANAGLILAHRRQRCPNINPALAQCIVFVGVWFSERRVVKK